VAATAERQLVRAQAKWVRMSARKGRLVAEHIRGRSVPEARAVLATKAAERGRLRIIFLGHGLGLGGGLVSLGVLDLALGHQRIFTLSLPA
jgi:ribosomal protein L22